MIDLKMVLEKYPDCMETRMKLSGLLRDLYPEEKRLVNIALDVYQCGIPARIAGLTEIDAMQLRAFIKLLDDEHGLQEQYALQGIALWAAAYGVKLEKGTVERAKSEKESSTQKGESANISGSAPSPIVHSPSAYVMSEPVIGSMSDYEVKDLPDGTLEIVKFQGFEQEDMTVPNVIDGKKVTSIGKAAFSHCTSIKKLTIPDGISTIGRGAFFGCSSVCKLTLPDRICSIGERAFINCKNLMDIALPKNLASLGEEAFSGCHALEKIDLPNGIAEIEPGTFEGCHALKTIVLPNHLEIIKKFAFADCSLDSFVCPKSLQEIGDYAFCQTHLKSLELNEGLKVIGVRSMKSCVFKSITIPSTVTEIGHEAFNKEVGLTLYCYAGSYGLQYARSYGYTVKNAAELSPQQ